MRLKKDAVPSVFRFQKNWFSTVQCEPEESPRAKRFKKRETEPSCSSVQYEVEVATSDTTYTRTAIDLDAGDEGTTKDYAVQCDIPFLGKLSVESFMLDDKIMNYYTGFSDYSHFMMFFNCLGLCAYELEFKCSLLHPKDQLFMTLMKLRQNKEDIELALLFKVSESTVSRIILTWINFLYFQLQELDIWPTKEVIQEFMPQDFKKGVHRHE